MTPIQSEEGTQTRPVSPSISVGFSAPGMNHWRRHDTTLPTHTGCTTTLTHRSPSPHRTKQYHPENAPHRVATNHQTHSPSSCYAPQNPHAAVTGVHPIEAVARRQDDAYNAICGVIAHMKRPAAERTAPAATWTRPTPRCPFHVCDEALPDGAIPDEATTPPLP